MTLTAPPQQSITEVAAAPVRPGRRPRKRSSAGGSRTLISTVDLNRHRVAYVVAITVTMIVFSLAFLYPLYWMASGVSASNAAS